MQKLRNRLSDVPDGWHYVVEATGERVYGFTFRLLVENVEFHMNINELDVPYDLSDIIEADICQRVPECLLKGNS